ncbi:pyruvate dehydrogenase complex dihydrolipoamide acetyltransferase [Caulobacter sp. S45]|uniref:pyruvate dehydrogenase complex dihydrolipoamide acetyltransferase n=1 Tax=Caulobacter sp. S45 TaxID=1641861 RepID=UPI0015751D95|nr:pyruvate dehydrogenase complex dihydrolipoamide acetyltransferase [Caulobacter sp. S45]
MTDILMPALSPTMEEGVLAKWHVKAGDTVSAGDVIAEIETDKATMEVEAVDEGVVDAILVPEGTEGVKVNSPIARLKGEGGTAAPTAPPAEQPKAAQSKDVIAGASSDDPRAARDQGQEEARERQADPGAKSPPRADEGAKPPSSASSPLSPDEEDRGGAFGSSSSGGDGGEADGGSPIAARIFASPLARRLAQQKGLDLSALKGSGPHGRIIVSDIEVAKPGAPAAQPQAAPPPASKPQAAPPAAPAEAKSLESLGIPPGSYDLIPLDGMRRTIARRLTESFRDVPHFPLNMDLEIDRLLDARKRINGALESRGVRVSVNDLLIKASALALKAVPEANASFTPEGIALHHHADVAVAVAIDGGLITPIIREAENRSLADLSTAMKDLAERARTRKLRPEEFQGGTFSLSNLGMFGIRSFSSILNQPQGCILSVGAGEKRPVVRGDALAVATVMSVTLTCDHRVVDGAIGARWVQAFKGFVEDPVTMLA